MNGIQGILLAAGSSTRFGSNKLLQPLADGTPLGISAAQTMQQVLSKFLVIIPPCQQELRDLLYASRIQYKIYAGAQKGMGASLAFGIKETGSASGWIVALADMPFIQKSTILQVAENIKDRESIAYPVYNGKQGHPVGLGSSYFDELTNLHGDHGAKSILRNHSERCIELDIPDEGVGIDIDTRADYENYCGASGQFRP